MKIKKSNWNYFLYCRTGIIATTIGMIAVNVDLGAYFAAWIYTIAFVLLFFPRRLINLGIFIAVNSLVFGIAARQLFPWCVVALISTATAFISLIKIDKKLSNLKKTPPF